MHFRTSMAIVKRTATSQLSVLLVLFRCLLFVAIAHRLSAAAANSVTLCLDSYGGDTEVSFGCNSTSAIVVLQAFYGRTSSSSAAATFCSNPAPNATGDCELAAQDSVASQCNSYGTCAVHQTSTYVVDSCTTGGSTYAHVQFDCLPRYFQNGDPIYFVHLDETTTNLQLSERFYILTPPSYPYWQSTTITTESANKCQITTTSNAIIQVDVLDFRVWDDAASSGNCSYHLYVYDGLTFAYREWSVGTNWAPDEPLIIDSSSSGVGDSNATRTIDIVFVADSGCATRIAAWLDVQGKFFDGTPVTNVNVTCGPNITLQSIQLASSPSNFVTDVPKSAADAGMTADGNEAAETTTTVKSETSMNNDAATVVSGFITRMSIAVVVLRLLR